MLLWLLLLLVLSFASSPASAFHIEGAPPRLAAAVAQKADQCTRRNILQRMGTIAGYIATAAALPANADIIRGPGKCANGEGEGCDSLAEDNEYIRSLQMRSSKNREANERETLNAFYMKNYPDVFAVSDQRMVRRPDGSFTLYSTEEVTKLVQGGRIRMEYPRSKGGRIADMTQKPVLVLDE